MSLRVQDLKKNDRVKDSEDTYRCLEDAECVNNIWQVKTVTGGEYEYMLRDTEAYPLEWDGFFDRIKERRKNKVSDSSKG